MTPAPLDPARERMLLLTLAGIQFAHILDFMVMMPLGPILMRELGVGTHEFGLLAAMFVNRFERKRLLLTMFAVFAVATLACGLAPGYWTLLAARGTAGAFLYWRASMSSALLVFFSLMTGFVLGWFTHSYRLHRKAMDNKGELLYLR